MKRYGARPSVRPPVCPCTVTQQQKHNVAGLLLWARRAEDIDGLLQQRPQVDECGQCHFVSVRR